MELNVVLGVLQTVAGLVSVFVALRALQIAREQLKPLKEQLERLDKDQKRREALKEEEPRSPRRIVGFDPRFTNRDWNEFLAGGGHRPNNLTPNLSHTYSDFHADIDRSFAEASKRSSVVVVDLLYLPYLMKEGKVKELTGADKVDFGSMLRRREALLGLKFDVGLTALLRALCSSESGEVGALPLWVNTHGRLMPDTVPHGSGRRLDQVASFDQLLEHEASRTLLCEAGIQSRYLTFEFMAHLAYRGCRIFRTTTKARTVTSDLLNEVPGERLRFAKAVADLAVRLHFYNETAHMFRHAQSVGDLTEENVFRTEHVGDARTIKEKVALWKPVFSSELLWRTLPRSGVTPLESLMNEVEFRPPYARHEGPVRSFYLSALGGYGLVLPADANHNADSLRALRHAFLSNPLLMHPYLRDMLPADADESAAEEFLSWYSRPRWPFWPDVEKDLGEQLLLLLLNLPRACGDDRPKQVWDRYTAFVLESDIVHQFLTDFRTKLNQTAAAAGWAFQH